MIQRLGALGLLWATAHAQPARWEQLAPLPVAHGVAAPFAGTIGGTLLVAGGANFPERPPWEGGKKVWHDGIWILESPGGAWRTVARLPRPLAYGVSLSTTDAMICVGGSDATRHHADVFQLRRRGDGVSFDRLPSLPIPLANACGVLLGTTVHVGTGSEAPGELAATNRAFALDLAAQSPVWRELPPLPGKPRLLATAAAHQGRWLIIGGVALQPDHSGASKREYLRDVWSFDDKHGWCRLADLPHPVAAAPSPAPAFNDTVVLFPGDDGSRAGFSPPDEHPGFPRAMLTYTAPVNKWDASGNSPAPRVTVPCVAWGNRFVIPSGEVRPGVRSPEVWSFLPP